ncbi:unnamed protein product [Didymodactylos carnosus]|uniref:Uncharacterized protein n=1 Tax=Didymodactylos carnosus TaxID=1234261 RepID=A0A814EKE6_9BILA|nr:unnamed protein product [Didymodactylos carnosus]CAF0973489.1 unnamed protein product [Didymodactylos carnosus]CAF3566070.1 unnamed protein product [Didymodactylos carnosus]CAF3746404.1 unnamed protein product [Didymodactylos carnosus]
MELIEQFSQGQQKRQRCGKADIKLSMYRPPLPTAAVDQSLPLSKTNTEFMWFQLLINLKRLTTGGSSELAEFARQQLIDVCKRHYQDNPVHYVLLMNLKEHIVQHHPFVGIHVSHLFIAF